MTFMSHLNINEDKRKGRRKKIKEGGERGSGKERTGIVRRKEVLTVWKQRNCVLAVYSIIEILPIVLRQAHFDKMENLPI